MLKSFFVHRIERVDTPFKFFICWLLLLLSLFDAPYALNSITDQSTPFDSLFHFLMRLAVPLSF